MKTIVCTLFYILLTFWNASGQEPEYKDADYEAGQIWSYQSRPGEENSTLTILAIENSKGKGVIISVFISGVSIKNPYVEGGVNTEIAHLAFSKEAISSSVVALKDKTDKLPPNSEEYTKWKHDFDAGKAIFFTVTVKEAISELEAFTNPERH